MADTASEVMNQILRGGRKVESNEDSLTAQTTEPEIDMNALLRRARGVTIQDEGEEH